MSDIHRIFCFSERLSGAELEWLSADQNGWHHRGPDGHRRLDLRNNRLSFIDLDGGAQPLGNEDGTVWVVRCSARSRCVRRLDLE
jgi:asparagine synthetase B (glutamine-hydrolysing)